MSSAILEGAGVGAVAGTTGPTTLVATPSPQPSVSITAALQLLDAFTTQYEGLHIVGGLLNSDYDAAENLYDTIDVQFEIIGRPGVYTVSVPFAENWIAIANYYIGLKAQMVEQIFEGKADESQLPDLLLVPVLTTSPTPIPLPGNPLPV